MINVVICGIVLFLVIMAVKNIIKNKGTCSCGNKDCHCCNGNCSDKK